MYERKINFGEKTVRTEIGKEVFQLAQNEQANITGRGTITSGPEVKFPLRISTEKGGSLYSHTESPR